MNCHEGSAITTAKFGYLNTSLSAIREAGWRGAPAAGATSWNSTMSPTSASAQSPAVAKNA
jgi:hypothetical protein